jgi:hypothetical protein
MASIPSSGRAGTGYGRVLALLAAAAVGSAAWLGFELAERRPPTQVAAERPTPEGDLQAELRMLRRQVAALSTNPQQLSTAQRQGATPVTSAAPAAPEATPEQIKERTDRRAELIERSLRAEPVDAAWARQAERTISETVAADPVLRSARLLSTECRSTMCRIEAGHSSRGEGSRFGSALPNRLGGFPSGTMRVQARGDRDFRTVIYLAREGHRIPRGGEQPAMP